MAALLPEEPLTYRAGSEAQIIAELRAAKFDKKSVLKRARKLRKAGQRQAAVVAYYHVLQHRPEDKVLNGTVASQLRVV